MQRLPQGQRNLTGGTFAGSLATERFTESVRSRPASFPNAPTALSENHSAANTAHPYDPRPPLGQMPDYPGLSDHRTSGVEFQVGTATVKVLTWNLGSRRYQWLYEKIELAGEIATLHPDWHSLKKSPSGSGKYLIPNPQGLRGSAADDGPGCTPASEKRTLTPRELSQLRMIFEILKKEPDAFCLQEVSQSVWSALHPLLNVLKKHGIHFSALMSEGCFLPDGGVMLLNEKKLRVVGRPLPGPLHGAHGHYSSGALVEVLEDKEGGRALLKGVHLPADPKRLKDAIGEVVRRDVSRYIEDQDFPVLLIGDWNTDAEVTVGAKLSVRELLTGALANRPGPQGVVHTFYLEHSAPTHIGITQRAECYDYAVLFPGRSNVSRYRSLAAAEIHHVAAKTADYLDKRLREAEQRESETVRAAS